ncbi:MULTISPECIES: hypothetical protein [unclassified Legionella]|uniref:hypothetical protein n=1 Tax=unclassified Legionella TaxID=2622702 RepID=UPI00105656A8|nr:MULTISPECIES: hypothetical protein [unclassified Legionella]MDI9819079.1 hypothetical protein [Legionella sp. PL877]
MNQDFLKRWSVMMTEMQKPFQSMMALNLRTWQNLQHGRSLQLSDLQQPQKLLDNQIKFAMEHSNQMLDYMRQSFQIMEAAISSMTKEAKNSPIAKSSTVKTAKTVKKASSSQKKSTASARKAASSSKMASPSTKPGKAKASPKKSSSGKSASKTAASSKSVSKTVTAKNKAADKNPKNFPNKVAKAVSHATMAVSKTIMPENKPSMGVSRVPGVESRMVSERKAPIIGNGSQGKTIPPHHPSSVFRNSSERMPEPKK